MTSSSSSLRFFLAVSLVVISLSIVRASGGHLEGGSWAAAVKPGGCQGPECLLGEAEGEFDTEVGKRRKLYSGGYICYGALYGDYVPCSIAGLSYYNCYTGVDANPYTRGCSYITQCRSDYGYGDYY